MLDLHIHGAFGIDVATADAERLDTLSRKLRARGITAFLPTLVPMNLELLAVVLERLARYVSSRRMGDGRGAVPLGIHFEGPFVSRARCGALRPAHFLDGSRTAEVSRVLSLVRDLPGRTMMTLAPEIPGGLGIVERLVELGVLVAVGHTDATVSTLDAAHASGARHVTHLANAMRPFHHRDVGPLGWALLRDDVTVDVIADLVHLSADLLRLVFKVKGASRVALISDAVAPAGLSDGTYEVWGEDLVLSKGAVRNASGSLAGSACLVDEAVARLASIGIPRDEAARSAGDVPRRILESAP